MSRKADLLGGEEFLDALTAVEKKVINHSNEVELYKSLIDSLDVGVAVVNMTLRVQICSQKFAELLGFASADPLYGRLLSQFFEDFDLIKNMMQNLSLNESAEIKVKPRYSDQPITFQATAKRMRKRHTYIVFTANLSENGVDSK